jgi:hypothetical protein
MVVAWPEMAGNLAGVEPWRRCLSGEDENDGAVR